MADHNSRRVAQGFDQTNNIVGDFNLIVGVDILRLYCHRNRACQAPPRDSPQQPRVRTDDARNTRTRKAVQQHDQFAICRIGQLLRDVEMNAIGGNLRLLMFANKLDVVIVTPLLAA